MTFPVEGIPLSYLRDLAGVSPDEIKSIELEAVTGYSVKLDNANEFNDPDNMIVLKVEGAPLTVDHGFPARFLGPSPSVDSGKCVKYLDSITFHVNEKSSSVPEFRVPWLITMLSLAASSLFIRFHKKKTKPSS
jgi:DMSO/TMAO reductase YedYZ molybdopterin-dependent catalytic subunit